MSFHDTLQPLDLSLRGNQVKRQAISKVTARRGHQSNRNAGNPNLLHESMLTTQQAFVNANSIPDIALRADIRYATNSTIHDKQRDQRELVSSLREVEMALVKGQFQQLSKTFYLSEL